LSWVPRPAAKLQPQAEALGEQVRTSPVIGSDETGARVDGVNHWQWVFETPQASFHLTAPSRAAQLIADSVGEAKPDVGLWLQASGVEAENGGGVYVFAEFCDATGQHRQREYVVGASDGGEIARPECASGSYEMRRLEASVTAPEGARWFRLAMGLRHCRGVASFDDIEIHTEPGQQPG
jgi:hypothetical protein